MRATALAVPVLSQCGHADIVLEGSVFNEGYKGPSIPYLSSHCDTAGCFFYCTNVLGSFRFETRREVWQVEVYVN